MKKTLISISVVGVLLANSAEIRIVGAEKLNNEYIDCMTTVVENRSKIEDEYKKYFDSIGKKVTLPSRSNFDESLKICLSYYHSKFDVLESAKTLSKEPRSYKNDDFVEKYVKFSEAQTKKSEMLKIFQTKKE